MNYRKIFLVGILYLIMGTLGAAPSPQSVPNAIDPDSSLHGVSFGATTEQVKKVLGAPTGSLQITETREALFYGKTHAFVFRKGRFVELQISEHLINWELAQQMEDHLLFNAKRWALKPGIKNGMDFVEVAKLLSKPNAPPQHELSYETEKALVELQFASRMDAQGKPESYFVTGVRIKSVAVQ